MSDLCVSDLWVCVCEMRCGGGGRWARRRRRRADEDLKTRTPHNDVGKNIIFIHPIVDSLICFTQALIQSVIGSSTHSTHSFFRLPIHSLVHLPFVEWVSQPLDQPDGQSVRNWLIYSNPFARSVPLACIHSCMLSC